MMVRVFMAAVMAMSASAAEPAPHRIGDLAWLAGCWAGQMGPRQVDEQWMQPSGGTMLGMSRTVAGGRTVATEFLQLREEGTDVYYVAQPSGQAEARFKLVDVADGRARFENPAHDFPQVIKYALGEGDALLAQIEGPSGGRTRTIDFPMRRVACR